MANVTRRAGLRASNVDKHPGQIVLDNTQKRRPLDVVAAEREAVAQKRQAVAEDRAARLKRLVEHRQKQKQGDEAAAESAMNAAHAPTTPADSSINEGKYLQSY